MTFNTLRSADGTALSYDDQGDGPSVVLLHGYAANAFVNWVRPGIAGALAGAGYRVLALDLRGHGRSEAPHQVDAYAPGRLVEDAAGLLDQAGVPGAVVGGYSLGARLGLLVAAADPRVRALVLGGVGEATLTGTDAAAAEAVAAAMEARRLADVEDRTGRAFRAFADATHSDRSALACLQRALPSWPAPTPGEVGVPCLVVAGSEDTLAGRPEPLAQPMEEGRAVTVPGNHMNAMLGPAFARAVLDFLGGLRPW
ncbi:MAG: alpha/beta fold hydrolase [Acidimicrobiales bacterium]